MGVVELFDIGPNGVQVAFDQVREEASGKSSRRAKMKRRNRRKALTAHALHRGPRRRDGLLLHRRNNAIGKNSTDAGRVLRKKAGSE